MCTLASLALLEAGYIDVSSVIGTLSHLRSHGLTYTAAPPICTHMLGVMWGEDQSTYVHLYFCVGCHTLGVVDVHLSSQAYSTPDDRLRQAEAERRRISDDLFNMRILYSTTLEDYNVVSGPIHFRG